MADTNWLRKGPAAADTDDDPFAELTRIMGFDPRVPFRGSQQAAPAPAAAAPQQVAAPNVDLSDDDLDLSIDLERELIGALEPEAAEPAVDHTAQQAPAHATRFQQPAMDGHDERPLDERAYGGDWPVPGAQAPDHSAAPDEYAADEAEFAEYVAADEPVPGEPQATGDQGYEVEETGTDYVRADSADDASADYEPYAVEHAQEPEAGAGEAYADAGDTYTDGDADHVRDLDLAAHLDEELVASFENDLADDQDDWLNEGDTAYAEQASEEAPRAAYDERSHHADEFAHDFDAAMAEVDMDFTAAPAAVGVEEALDDAAHHAVRAEIEHDLGLEDDLGSALADDLHARADEQEESEVAHAFGPSYASDVGEFAEGSEDEQTETSGAEPAYASQALDVDAESGDRPDLDTDSGFDHEAQFNAQPDVEQAQEQQAEDPVQSEIDDAIAELAAMVRGYDSPRPSAVAPQNAVEAQAPPAEPADVPDIETVDVPEEAVALADDLDIPDVDYSQDAAPQFDDLDAELAAAFGEPAIETMQPAPAETRAGSQDFDLHSGYDAGQNAAFHAAPYAIAAGAGAAAARYAQANAGAEDFQVRRQPQDGDYDFEVDTELDEDLATAGHPAMQPRPSMRRGLFVASIVGGIAVVGAIGAFAFSGGDGIASSEPALVKADADPIKIKPENPGGTKVPNQESQVFDRAAGATAEAPGQQQLISNEEEPVDMATRFPEALPQPIDESADIDELADAPSPGEAASSADASAKGEDRIEQAIAAAENQPDAEEAIAVAPRKVRTMIVKSDGTLVPREDVAPEPETVGSTTAADSLTDPAISAPPAAPTADLSAANARPAAEAPAGGPSPAPAQEAAAAPEIAAAPPAQEPAAAPAQETAAAPSQETAAAPAAEAPRPTQSSMPDSVPVAPSRPADQPLDIVGEVKPDQVAALQPAKPAAGSWSMQIASQPSEAAAQSTYRDLSRRYSSVLGDRTANIVKAEIAGKGTFWRVRVPAESRNEAIKLCESYKAAGGNCFVSK